MQNHFIQKYLMDFVSRHKRLTWLLFNSWFEKGFTLFWRATLQNRKSTCLLLQPRCGTLRHSLETMVVQATKKRTNTGCVLATRAVRGGSKKYFNNRCRIESVCPFEWWHSIDRILYSVESTDSSWDNMLIIELNDYL